MKEFCSIGTLMDGEQLQQRREFNKLSSHKIWCLPTCLPTTNFFTDSPLRPSRLSVLPPSNTKYDRVII